MVDASGAKASLGDLEAAPFAEEQVLHRHAHVLQQHFGVAVRRVVITEHRQHPLHHNPLGVEGHEDLALLGVGLGGRVGLAHHDGDLAAGIAKTRRPPLATVDDILIAVTDDGGLDVRRVRRGDRRLRHQKGRADLAIHQRAQPLLLLLAGAVALQHLHVAGVGSGAVEHLRRKTHPAHDLGDAGVFEVRQLGALELERVVQIRMPRMRRHEHVPEPFGLGLRLQSLDDLDHLPAISARHVHLRLIERNRRIDVGLHEGRDTIDPVLLAVRIGEFHDRAPP